MARRRCQNPTPRKEGKWWVLYYWSDEFVGSGGYKRRKKRKPLAPVSIPKREAQKIALEFLRPINQGFITVGSATPFDQFVTGTYVPVVLPQMAKSTQDRYRGILKNYLLPRFGRLALRDVTLLTAEKYFVELRGTELHAESLDKIRDVLSSVLGAAVRYELLIKNPVETLRLPQRKTGKRAKPWIKPEEFAALVNRIAEPYATMVFVAVYTGCGSAN